MTTLSAFAAFGCASGLQPNVQAEASGIDPKLTLTSFIEEGALVGLIVSIRPTLSRAELNYIPFEVGVINKGLGNLTLTLESFTLIDGAGNRYPAVGEAELSENYDGVVSGDFRLAELDPVLRGRHVSYFRQPSQLSPTARADLNRQEMPRFSYTVNMLYFPRPAAGVRGQPFELFMSAPELEDPVFVRFGVPAKKR